MDHSHFLLTLDTTGPDIEIYMPTYATPNVDNEIIVQANERLSTWQEFYFIDGVGTRHDFIFEYNGNRFIGLVRFNQFAVGVAKLYAQVRDEVYNPSALVTQSLNIIGGGAYMSISAAIKTREFDMDMHIKPIYVNTTYREIDINTIFRLIEVSMNGL